MTIHTYNGDNWTASLLLHMTNDDGVIFIESESLDLVDFGPNESAASDHFSCMIEMFMEDIIERNTFHEVLSKVAFKMGESISIHYKSRLDTI